MPLEIVKSQHPQGFQISSPLFFYLFIYLFLEVKACGQREKKYDDGEMAIFSGGMGLIFETGDGLMFFFRDWWRFLQQFSRLVTLFIS